MKICGHTLGTPDYTVEEAGQLFKSVNLDGAEIVFADNYKSGIPERRDTDYWKRLQEYFQELSFPVVALTPYMHKYSSLDSGERQESIRKLKACIDCAAVLGAANIRIYAGEAFKDDDLKTREKREEHFIETMRECSYLAGEKGISLNIENHFNTLCETAGETARIISAINSPYVNILYDQANIDFVFGEGFEEAIDLQLDRIVYVHVKDYIRVTEDKTFQAQRVDHVKPEERAVRSRIPGEGNMDWLKILRKLKADGYEGLYSLEVEKRWHPEDLPSSRDSFSRGAEYIKKLWAEI